VTAAQERARRIARYYDLDLVDIAYDAELYQELAHEAGGPVYELAVGSGRLAIPLALAGHQVVGVDHDPAMLERARRAWDKVRGDIEPQRLRLFEGDLRSFRPSGRFGLAFIAVNTFLLAEDDAARSAILTRMRMALRPGGIAAVEFGTPDDQELAGYDGRLHREWLRRDPETGDDVSKSMAAEYDGESNTLRLAQTYEWTRPKGPRGRVTNVDTLHLLAAQRLGDLATQAGFSSVDLWGDHLLIPYGAGSHRVILVARLV
jgi:ubiquinone/menaquinone biosynthesis C-methylase UbiE